MKYMYARNKYKKYNSVGELLDKEDLVRVVNLEQQRMFLDDSDSYNKNKYVPIHCKECYGECEDIWYTENIKQVDYIDFCSKECLENYVLDNIDYIDEILVESNNIDGANITEEDKICKECINYSQGIYENDDWCHLLNEYTEAWDVCKDFKRKQEK